MQHTATQDFEKIRDEAWKAEPALKECWETEDLLQGLLKAWRQWRPYFEGIVPGKVSREEARTAASDLRLAEQAFLATLWFVARSMKEGYPVQGSGDLEAALREVRSLIVRPMARRMAARDPEKRSAEQITEIILRRARFVDGRPVITEGLAAELPCPFDPEPEPAA